MAHRTVTLSSLLLATLLATLPQIVNAASTTSLAVNVYNSVVDEQDTNAFYNSGSGSFCSGLYNPVQESALMGESQLLSPATAYQFGTPWSLFGGLYSTSYVDKADCGKNCLRVQFSSQNKIMLLDSRGTAGPRDLTVDFSQPCGAAQGCPGPAGDPNVFGGSLSVPVLMNVFLDSPYTSMAVCSSRACAEAQPAFAKLWFTDPAQADVTWRIDWHYLRVLRMSANAWYFIGDACDGSQVAGLSKLSGQRTQPKTVLNGYYLIPFFFSAVR